MMRSASCLLALVLVGSSATNATTVIIRRTPEYIVVGADSLWIHDSIVTDQNGRHSKHVVTHECKINQFHDTFFTHAGFVMSNWLPLAEKAAREGTTMAEKAAIYNSLIKTRLEAEMEQTREQLPDAYRKVIGSAGSAFEAAFFGMEHGRPMVAIVVYQLANLPSQRVALQCQIPGCVLVQNENTWSNAFMGQNDEIKRYGEDEQFWNSNGSDEAIRKLIKIEMAAHPDFVGGDIDMLSISSSGVHWVEHGRECPEIKPIATPHRK